MLFRSTNPIFLYMSGGIDSEMVACALLDSHRPFTPVIFQWADTKGNIQNARDTEYAFRFCQKHGLTALVETVDLETLWRSAEFEHLQSAIKIASPQLATHVWMVEKMNATYPNKCHLFGGEVRYQVSYPGRTNENAFLVTLGKVVPAFNNYAYVTWAIGELAYTQY